MAILASKLPLFTVVPQSKLFVSEPPPEWFGNGPNEAGAAWTNGNWLKSRFHFSFAEYRNYENSNFGALRVMNDDLVQPKRGFGTHGHQDAEIMTYVIEGGLTHQDSMGNKGLVQRGGIQYMSAGSGVRHSEFNHGDRPLRFIQCWATPDARGVDPVYGQFDGEASGRTNQLQHLVSAHTHQGVATPIKVHQDLNLFVSELMQVGASVSFAVNPGRMAYLLCIEGAIELGGGGAVGDVQCAPTQVCKAERHDAVEIQGPTDRDAAPVTVTVTASRLEAVEGGAQAAHFMMFEMKQDPRGGRGDLAPIK